MSLQLFWLIFNNYFLKMDSQEKISKYNDIKIEERGKKGGYLESSKKDGEHGNNHESNGSFSNTKDGKYRYITGTFIAKYCSHIFLWLGFSSFHHFLLQSAGNCQVWREWIERKARSLHSQATGRARRRRWAQERRKGHSMEFASGSQEASNGKISWHFRRLKCREMHCAYPHC